MHRPELPTVAALLAGASRVVVLEDIVDHTNVGAIFRACAALGVDAVLVTPRCADPLYRAAFGSRWARCSRCRGPASHLGPAGSRCCGTAGFTVAALALTDDAVSLDVLAADPPERLALVLGAEGDGLSRRTTAAADLVVRIPMAGGVDSLNVAAASAVALWALRPPQR